MLIEIKEDIFRDNDFKGLNFLIQLATYKDRYDLFIDLSLVQNTASYLRLDNDDKAILEGYFDRFIQNSEKLPKFIVSGENNDGYNLQESIRFLNQPVAIVIENSLNDAYFLKALIRLFDESGNIQRHLDNNWLQFENAGGYTNIENFISAKLQMFDKLLKANKYYLRCFVIMDSDKTYLRQKLDTKKRDIRTWLNTRSIPCHILEKRNIENYLPDKGFDLITDSNCQAWIRIYRNLNAVQRDFFNISQGITNKKKGSTQTRANLELNVQNLYSTISENDFEILDKGLKMHNFKSEFPKLFEHLLITKVSLLERTSHQQNPNELQEIINKIAELL
jgi:cob(I)alamin adenosyltransferase